MWRQRHLHLLGLGLRHRRDRDALIVGETVDVDLDVHDAAPALKETLFQHHGLNSIDRDHPATWADRTFTYVQVAVAQREPSRGEARRGGR